MPYTLRTFSLKKDTSNSTTSSRQEERHVLWGTLLLVFRHWYLSLPSNKCGDGFYDSAREICSHFSGHQSYRLQWGTKYSRSSHCHDWTDWGNPWEKNHKITCDSRNRGRGVALIYYTLYHVWKIESIFSKVVYVWRWILCCHLLPLTPILLSWIQNLKHWRTDCFLKYSHLSSLEKTLKRLTTFLLWNNVL